MGRLVQELPRLHKGDDVPLTTVDERGALLIIDLQEGLAELPAVGGLDLPTRQSARLAAAFRARGWPVVLVSVGGAPPGRSDRSLGSTADSPRFTEPLAGIGHAPGDLRIVKGGWSAFHDTGLHELLRAEGVTQVFLTGVATSLGVESTARAAHEYGYNVVVVEDAVADIDAAAHTASLRGILPGLSEVDSTARVLAAVTGGLG